MSKENLDWVGKNKNCCYLCNEKNDQNCCSTNTENDQRQCCYKQKSSILPWIGDDKIEERRIFSYKPPSRFFLTVLGSQYEYGNIQDALNNIVYVNDNLPVVEVLITNSTDPTQYRTTSFNTNQNNEYPWKIWQLDTTSYMIRYDFVTTPMINKEIIFTCLIDNIPRSVVLNLNTSWQPSPIHGSLILYSSTYRQLLIAGTQALLDSTIISQNDVNITNQSPTGFIDLLANWKNIWQSSTWDGVPLSRNDLLSFTKLQLRNFLFPTSPYVLRGSVDFYFSQHFFVDVFSPTAEEIDYLNVSFMNFFRRLCGVNVDMTADRYSFLQAQWALESKWGSLWGIDCSNNNNLGCGQVTIPSHTDQIPYLTRQGETAYNYISHSDINYLIPTYLPWSCKFSYFLYNILGAGSTGELVINNNGGSSLLLGDQLLRRPYIGFGVHILPDGTSHFKMSIRGTYSTI